MIRMALLVFYPFTVLTLLSCSPTTTDQTSAATLRGEELYSEHCAECHEQPHPDLLKQPPNLHGTFGRKTLPSGAPATDKQVRKTIIEGRGTMPAFDKRLSNEELDELVQYLHTLK